MIAHPHRSARRASSRSTLAILAAFALMPLTPLTQGIPSAMAAETTRNGDWFCERSEADGRWSCRRLSESEKNELDGNEMPAENAQFQEPDPESVPVVPVAEVPVSEEESETLALQPQETLEVPPAPSEPYGEAPEPAVIEPSDEQAVFTPEPDPEPVSEPVRRPEPTHARAPDYDPVQTGNADERPDYQRLAYVPEKPTSLLQLPGDFWVAQLMAVSSKEFLEEYAAEHQLRGLSAARVASDDRLFYVLILGIYENKALAQQAIADLPPPYDQYNPFLRSLKSLQQAMRKADEMAGGSQF